MQDQEEHQVGCKDHMQFIKGKRTKRQRQPSPLRLAMSSSSSAGRSSPENSGTTSSVDHELRNRTEEEEDMANCLILLAQGHHHTQKASHSHSHHDNNNNNNNKAGLFLYQCKTCNRCFPSFQALGGHRASHKKPKANTAAGTEEKQAVTTFVNGHDDYDTTNTTLTLQLSSRALYSSSTTTTTTTKSKVHECSICGAEFTSGQALGGHMRRHRTSLSSGGSPKTQEAKTPRNVLKLDLNLPAPEDDNRSESKFPFQSKEKVIVFSATSLVDCHY